MTKTRGILLLALGQPHYGNYAANLAMSIKFNCPDMPIALIHDEGAIRHISADKRLQLFDELIEAPKDTYVVNGHARYIRAKNFLTNLVHLMRLYSLMQISFYFQIQLAR